MTNWKAKLINLPVVLAALGALALLVGECRDFSASGKPATAPQIAQPTKLEQKAEPKVLPCRDVQAIEPGERVRQKLAEKYRRPDLAPDPNARAFELGITQPTANAPRAEILGERELPELPAGGTALVTFEPDGRTEITVIAKPEKLFEWRATYEAGAAYGVGQSPDGGDTRGRAWAAVEPFRFARLHLRAEAGVDLRNGTSDTYALAGIVWRSR